MKVTKSHDINGNLCLNAGVTLTDRIGTVEVDDVSIGLLKGDRFALNFVFKNTTLRKSLKMQKKAKRIVEKFEQNYLFEPRYIITMLFESEFWQIENDNVTRYVYVDSEEDFNVVINNIWCYSRTTYLMTNDVGFKDDLAALCRSKNINHKY